MTLKKIEFGAATAFLALVVYNMFSIARQIISLGTKSGMERPFIEQGIPFNYATDYAKYYLYPDLIVAIAIYAGFLILNFIVVPRFYDKAKYSLAVVYTLLVFLAEQLTFALASRQQHAPFHSQGFTYYFHKNFYGVCMILWIFIGYTVIKKAVQYYRKKQKTLVHDIIQKVLFAAAAWSVVMIILESNGESTRAIIPFWGTIVPSVFFIFMVNFYWLIPNHEHKQQHIRSYFIKLLPVSFIIYVPFGFILGLRNRAGVGPGFFGVWIAELAFTVPLAWYIYRRNKERVVQLLNLKTALSKTEANLIFLRSQINPHFLFNALNTLYGTALQENAERTGEGIQKLGDMMRFMLQENNRDQIPLTREVDYLNNYISLQKLRTQASDGIVIQTEISEPQTNLLIAPMLLIPFVENAFKHGISFREPSHINISLKSSENELIFEVSNSVHPKADHDPEKDKSGIGLANVKQRLQLLYPGRHKLIIRESGKEFFIQLTLNLQIE